jgi:hypothetical protein
MAKRSSKTGRYVSRMRELSDSVSKRNQKIHSGSSRSSKTTTPRKKTA